MKQPFTVMTKDSRRSKGFTLIEMMVVVAMIALIVAAVAPMVFGTLISTRLSSAGETLAGQISLAHQIAVSRNMTVEVRFYEYDDPEAPGSGSAVRAVAIMQASETGQTSQMGKQLTDTYYLPSGIAVGSSTSMSPLLATSAVRSEADREKIIKRSPNARYKAFQIRGDGSTNIEQIMRNEYMPNKSYITLAEDRAIGDGQNVPKNFYAVQIDPVTGRTTSYRP